MSWFQSNTSHQLLDVIERIEKLHPEWNVKVEHSGLLPYPNHTNTKTRIWFTSDGIGVSISKEHLRISCFSKWRGDYWIEAWRFDVFVTAEADNGKTRSVIYEGYFTDEKKEPITLKHKRDIATCNYLHEYIDQKANPILQAEAERSRKRHDEYEAKRKGEEKAKQEKLDAIENKFWKG